MPPFLEIWYEYGIRYGRVVAGGGGGAKMESSRIFATWINTMQFSTSVSIFESHLLILIRETYTNIRYPGYVRNVRYRHLWSYSMTPLRREKITCPQIMHSWIFTGSMKKSIP